MERSKLFVQVVDRTQPLSKIPYRPKSLHDSSVPVQPWNIFARNERQVIRPLPKSGAILCSAKTDIRPLMELELDELRAFAAEVRSWSDRMAMFKGEQHWGECALQYCHRRNVGGTGYGKGDLTPS